MAARPRTLPAAIAPVLVGTAAAVEWAGQLPRVGAFLAALLGSIFIQIGTNLANDYSDAQAGRRHGRPARAGAGHLGRAGDAAAGAERDLDRLRRRRRLRDLPGGGRRDRDPADRRRLDRRRRALHRRPAPLRLRRARRGLRLPLLRPGRRQRLLLRAARAARRAAAGALDLGRLPRHRDPRRQQRARPRDRPAGRQDDPGGADGTPQRRRPLPRCWCSAPSSSCRSRCSPAT